MKRYIYVACWRCSQTMEVEESKYIGGVVCGNC